MESTKTRLEDLSEAEKVRYYWAIEGRLNQRNANAAEMGFLKDFADKWSSPRAMAKYGIALVEGTCIKKDEAKGTSYMYRAMNDKRADGRTLAMLADEFARIGTCMLVPAMSCIRKAADLGDQYAGRVIEMAKKILLRPETHNA